MGGTAIVNTRLTALLMVLLQCLNNVSQADFVFFTFLIHTK